MTAAQRKRIAEKIRSAIERSELTRAEISRRSGVDQAILSRFVNGTGGLTLESIERLAPVLGFDITTAAKGNAKR